MGDGVCIVNKDYAVVFANPVLEKTFGAWQGKKCYTYFHDSAEVCPGCRNKEVFEGKTIKWEWYSPKSQKTYELLDTPLKNVDGSISKLELFRDITERKNAESLLLSALSRYRSFIDVTGQIGWTTNPEGKVVDDIPSFREFTGQTLEEVMGGGWSRALHPDDFENTIRVWKEATKLRNKYEVEYRLRRHDGVYRWFLARGVPVFKVDNSVQEWVGTCIDITERKNLQETIQKNNALNTLILDAMPNPTMLIRKDRTVIAANKVALGLGAKVGEPCWREFGKCMFLHDKSDMCWFCLADEALWEAKGRQREVEAFGRIWDTWWVPADNETYLHFAIDITDRKEMENELRDTLEASHRRQSEISALLNASKAVLQHQEFKNSARVIFDCCKELLGATAGYVALLNGGSREENDVLFLDSGGLSCTVDPSLGMPIRGLREEAYAKGKVVYHNDFANSKYTKLLPKGHVMLDNVLFAPLIINQTPVGVIGLANKLGGFTERDAEMALAFGEIASVALINSKTLDTIEAIVEERTRKLKDSERLAAIGETAGMVGHDIRNPLQAITCDLYLVKSELALIPQSDVKKNALESLGEIEKNIDYINKIVADLQDFARPLTPRTEEVDLKQIIDELLTKNPLPDNIQVSVKIKSEISKVIADSIFLTRIIYNLVSNAQQAMPKGGNLNIKAQKNIKNQDIIITVKDTGVGIPESVRGKLFTPMFTTKSKGQGFGLVVVKRMTEAIGGTVTFESEVGRGTKFKICLPQPKKEKLS